MCMNFSAITLALLFMSITLKEKKKKEKENAITAAFSPEDAFCSF